MHVVTAAKAFGWVGVDFTVDDTRAILEEVIPRFYWMHFNEVYGAVGQILGRPKNRKRVLLVLEQQSKKITIRKGIMKWMQMAERSNKNLPHEDANKHKRKVSTLSSKPPARKQHHGK